MLTSTPDSIEIVIVPPSFGRHIDTADPSPAVPCPHTGRPAARAWRLFFALPLIALWVFFGFSVGLFTLATWYGAGALGYALLASLFSGFLA